MDALAPLLGRSPRGLKRFLNTYRLVKVRAPDAIGFLAEARPLADFRIVLFLLALCTGTPHAAASFLDATLAGEPADAATMLKNLATLPDERGRLEDWLADPVSEPWRTLAAADLRDWAAEVARFTFHASPGTHTPAA